MTYFSFLWLVKIEKPSLTYFCSLLWNFDYLFEMKLVLFIIVKQLPILAPVYHMPELWWGLLSALLPTMCMSASVKNYQCEMCVVEILAVILGVLFICWDWKLGTVQCWVRVSSALYSVVGLWAEEMDVKVWTEWFIVCLFNVRAAKIQLHNWEQETMPSGWNVFHYTEDLSFRVDLNNSYLAETLWVNGSELEGLEDQFQLCYFLSMWC